MKTILVILCMGFDLPAKAEYTFTESLNGREMVDNIDVGVLSSVLILARDRLLEEQVLPEILCPTPKIKECEIFWVVNGGREPHFMIGPWTVDFDHEKRLLPEREKIGDIEMVVFESYCYIRNIQFFDSTTGTIIYLHFSQRVEIDGELDISSYVASGKVEKKEPTKSLHSTAEAAPSS